MEAQSECQGDRHPWFTIGPLFVQATVTPALGPVRVEILWSLVIPPDRSSTGVELLGARTARSVRAHFHVGRSPNAFRGDDRGGAITRETLARIVPGETTYDQVIGLCGPEPEVSERLTTPEQRTLIYRGHHVVPQRRPIFAWLARVTRWDVEDQEIEIALEREVVRDVQVRVRRARLAEPGP